MKKVKVVRIENEQLVFDDGTRIFSRHEQDCCETHYLDFEHLDLDDFEGLLFDLSGDDFSDRINDYGIELKPIQGYSVKIPGYGYNNGYYGENIDLVVADANGVEIKSYDVSECQKVEDLKNTAQ